MRDIEHLRIREVPDPGVRRSHPSLHQAARLGRGFLLERTFSSARLATRYLSTFSGRGLSDSASTASTNRPTAEISGAGSSAAHELPLERTGDTEAAVVAFKSLRRLQLGFVGMDDQDG